MRLRFDSMALIVVVGLLATVMLGSTAHAQDMLTPAEARARPFWTEPTSYPKPSQSNRWQPEGSSLRRPHQVGLTDRACAVAALISYFHQGAILFTRVS